MPILLLYCFGSPVPTSCLSWLLSVHWLLEGFNPLGWEDKSQQLFFPVLLYEKHQVPQARHLTDWILPYCSFFSKVSYSALPQHPPSPSSLSVHLPHALLPQSPPTAISSFGFLLGSASFLLFYRKPSHDFLPTPFLQGSLSSPSAPLLSQPIPCCCLDPPNQFLETCKALRYLWLKKMSPELENGESYESISSDGIIRDCCLYFS